VDRDPPVAISGARVLIEATTKLAVASSLANPSTSGPTFRRRSRRLWAVHPDVIAPDAKGVENTKRFLSGLSQIAATLAELCALYGPDHGRPADDPGQCPAPQ
jgi:hypothetical protein